MSMRPCSHWRGKWRRWTSRPGCPRCLSEAWPVAATLCEKERPPSRIELLPVERNFLADFPGLAGRTYLNSAAESLFMASHEAAFQRYAQAKALGEPGRPRFYAA